VLKTSDAGAHAPDKLLRSRLSDSIGIARAICILGVVYVHAWTGWNMVQLAAVNGTFQSGLRWGLMELLGRSAVPLLGMISGWLVAEAALKRDYRTFITGKARTILLPMVLWNTLGVVIVSGLAVAGLVAGPQPKSPIWVINEILCLFAPGEINVQMPFLRDMMVCMLAAPLLARLPNVWLIAIAAAAAIWSVSGIAFPLLLRPSILLFFVAGMLARRNNWATRVIGLPIAAAEVPFVALALLKVALINSAGPGAYPHLLAGLDIAMRFAAALCFWRLAWRLAGSSAASPILKIEPYAFLLFCSHLIFIWLAGPLIGGLTGKLGAPLYPLYLVAQPFLALGAALLLGQALMRYAPTIARVLSGGRLKPGLNIWGARRTANDKAWAVAGE
jgi:hypothetical protein